MNLGDEGLVLSAVKKCEERNSLIVRLYNPGPDAIKAALTTCRTPKAAHETNLNEKRTKALRVVKGAVPYRCGGFKVLTMELVF